MSHGVVSHRLAAVGNRHDARSYRLRLYLLVLLAYSAASIGVWWNAWSSHPATNTTCGCGDSALFLWFLEWPAYAISHGHSLFFSTSLFHPQGINLLSNTSVLAIGVVLAPVTWIFGVVATMNVALTLAPVLSALAMFWLLRRWIDWQPAAFVGGLLYGFSPFVMTSLVDAHLMTGLLAIPPLIVGCLDELLVRQRHSPRAGGIALASLAFVEFFVSTELLVITAIMVLLAIIVMGGYALIAHRDVLRLSIRHALVGLAWAGGAGFILLAYPAWFALRGPASLSGPIWPGFGAGFDGSTPAHWIFPSIGSSAFVRESRAFGGYQGRAIVQEYFGIALFAVLVIGIVLWRRDRRLWLFATLGIAAFALSLGSLTGRWVPWMAVAKRPFFENIIQDRFVALAYLAVAVMIGLIADRVHDSMKNLATPAPSHTRRHREPSLGLRVLPSIVGLAIACTALGPIAVAYGGTLPMTIQPTYMPRWFAEIAPHLPPGQVVLAYPAPSSGRQSAMAWQAVDRMHFAMATGGSPEGIASRAGKERVGFQIINDISLAFAPPPGATPGNLRAVREALSGWGVTKVVVPDDPSLPSYEDGTQRPYALAYFTAALGARPQYQAQAWVWSLPSRAPQVNLTSQAFSACVTGGHLGAVRHMRLPDCVLSAARSSSSTTTSTGR